VDRRSILDEKPKLKKESLDMRPTFILCSLMFSSLLAAFAQNGIDLVSAPPELSDEPKKVNKPSEADEQVFEIMKHLGKADAEAKANLPKLDDFLKRYPDYSDAYFLRATHNACISNNHDFD